MPVRPASAADHRREHDALQRALEALEPAMGWYGERTAPYPLTVTAADVALLDRLYRAIAAGITRVVERYLVDERLRAILSLPVPLVELLRRVDGRPHRPGALRPDFLLDLQGTPQVCEVNARFPTNGFMCSYYTNEVTGTLDHLARTGASAVAEMRRTLDALAARFEPAPLVVLLDREGGTEVFLFVEELRRRGVDARARRPSELRVEHGSIVDDDGPVEQFILELERDELLDLPIEVFDALARCDRTFNDVRTLILGHDKRMLAVLGERSIMSDLLGADDVELLARHIIPTFHAGDGRVAASLRADPSSWVLKRNSSGRGIDLLVGRSCDPAAWRDAVERQADDRAAQAFVEQLVLSMPALDERGELVDQPVHVVGLLPGFDGEPFGPGLFRASAESVINVAGGRGVLVPTMVST